MLMVNCRAMLCACSHFGRRFRQRGRGGLVLLSSIAAFQGMPYAAHDAATKAHVQSLAEALQLELQQDGVDVLAAAPGPTHSGFAARAGQRLGTALQPDAIAQPILDALGRQATVLPGFLSKLLTMSLVPLARWVQVRIKGNVMLGMSQPPVGIAGAAG
ncbi:SDR family NAD(P)-dependent oxidoreductase [Synechococcus sp. Tobar12-5m-g]|uniref:SDR family NAD(P)-dependent oxidoreductase n=1 Tax=unclassified Synechococcus TaxID=2626047 RepID=UPI0020CFBAB3|nr:MULTISPECIES: SDR family NAD(P)-dependent oxidoreductase [unclassified Synechococcus]MCP9771194.1 SDR family NAD(P)-dependent oxidoreductase [Synechococcus sp. Tobar12-5m-g]MCP9872134.1 SDR family NAD(P)-dependent oxidoreductase [Synechococcus sp. Cruz CV-v-12]